MKKPAAAGFFIEKMMIVVDGSRCGGGRGRKVISVSGQSFSC
jgi:hypothetical protein